MQDDLEQRVAVIVASRTMTNDEKVAAIISTVLGAIVTTTAPENVAEAYLILHSHLCDLDEDDPFGNALATVLDYAAERQEQQMRAAATRVAVLEAENARLREASGYWRSEDREFGYPDLNELLDGYEYDEPVRITPWRDLPDGFAAWTEEQGWAFYGTEADARAAIAAAKGA
jgi:hypothetical protein